MINEFAGIIERRQYQLEDADNAMDHGVDDIPIHCAPTGSGKTVIQAMIAKRELDRGNRTAIFTPRNEIFNQTHALLVKLCGVENVARLRAKRPGEAWQVQKPIHVVSWPTVVSRRGRGMGDFWLPKVERLLVDEAHLAVAERIGEILEHYKGNTLIDGYTATPARLTGRGLGTYFTEIKHVVSVRQLVKDGWLAPCEYWGGATPDLTGMPTSRGDYKTEPLSAVCVTLVGDVIDNWLRLASTRHTIVFAVDIAHCEALAERFQKVGVSAAALHVRLDPALRDRIVEQFKAGEIQVLVNVSIASYGFDAPSVNCIVAARPTKSIVLHLQMIGRGMRPKPDGSECMVLDHAGNVNGLGRADDLFRWTLDSKKRAASNWSKDERSGEAEEAVQHTCNECGHIFARSRVCPKCGWEVPFGKRDVSVVDADLVPIGKTMAKKLPEGWPSHEFFFRMLVHVVNQKGRKIGWARHTFKKKCGVWPPKNWDNLTAIPPTKRVQAYIHSRNIAYAAVQRKLKAQGLA